MIHFPVPSIKDVMYFLAEYLPVVDKSKLLLLRFLIIRVRIRQIARVKKSETNIEEYHIAFNFHRLGVT